jgi:hypothetical protein
MASLCFTVEHAAAFGNVASNSPMGVGIAQAPTATHLNQQLPVPQTYMMKHATD